MSMHGLLCKHFGRKTSIESVNTWNEELQTVHTVLDKFSLTYELRAFRSGERRHVGQSSAPSASEQGRIFIVPPLL